MARRLPLLIEGLEVQATIAPRVVRRRKPCRVVHKPVTMRRARTTARSSPTKDFKRLEHEGFDDEAIIGD